MRLITNRIHMSKPTKSVEDLVKEARARSAGSQIKTASSEGQTKVAAKDKEVKVAFDPDFGGKKAPEFGSKDKGKGEDEEKSDEKGEEKEGCDEGMTASAAKKEVEIKVAEDKAEKCEETYDAGKKEGTEFTNDDIKEPKEADTKPFTGGDKKPDPKMWTDEHGNKVPTSGQTEWEGKPENNNKPVLPNDENTKASIERMFTMIKAQLDKPFEKVANLKPALKKSTKDYWRTLFGEDYADAMVADK